MTDQLPTDAITDLFEATEPMLDALKTVVDRHAARTPDRPAPASTLAEARAVLAAVRRVLSRTPGRRGLLELRGATSWAALESKLALAATAFAGFKRLHRHYEPVVEDYLWSTVELAALDRAYPESPEPFGDPGDLDGDAADLDDDLARLEAGLAALEAAP